MRMKTTLPLALLLAALPFAADAAPSNVTVHVTGALPPTGNLEITLFDSPDSFLKQPWMQQKGSIGEDGASSVTFAAVPDGEYAVVVVHDANGNNTYDNGFLGFGAERFGYTVNEENIHWYRFLFGRPGFDEARFSVTGDTEVTVELD